MLDGLKDYLQTAPGTDNWSSKTISSQIADVSNPESFTNAWLSYESSTTDKWTHHFWPHYIKIMCEKWIFS